MSTTSTIRSIGVTTAVSVGATATSAVLIQSNTNDKNTFVSLINTGSTAVAVVFGPSDVADPVVPVSGSTTGNFVLPPSMNAPIIFEIPTTPCYVKMIGSAAGPSIVYVTPVAM